MKLNSKKNNSFISNQELISGLRNRSSKSLLRNRSVQANISLIQPKNYEREKSINRHQISQIQNQNTNPNSQLNTCRLSKQSITENLMKFLRDNISNKMILHQTQALIKEISNNQNCGISKQEAALMAKIEQLYLQKTKIKKEKKVLQQRLKDQSAQFTNKERTLKKQNQRLHKLVLKQSEMIINQTVNQDDDTQDLRRILYSQAKTIEGLEYQKNMKQSFGGRKNNR